MRRAATAILVAIALVCATASAASAATTYSHLGQFGGTGTAGQPGLFHNTTAPQRMAVHQGSGKLFVADRGNNRVQVFNPTVSGADFAYQINVSAPVGVAIDQTSGDLFVTNATAIAKFNPDSSVNPTAYTADATFTSPAIGVGVGQIGALRSGANDLASPGGIAVDPDTGDVLVADVGRHLIQRFDSDGVFVSSFNGASGGRPAFTGIKDLAVTSTGGVIVADVSGALARVDRFNGAGVLQATLSQSNSPVPNPSVGAGNDSGMTVAVNEVDEVFVSSVSTMGFVPTSPVSRVYQFENDVNVANFTAPANFAGMLYGMVGSDDPARLYVLAGNQFAGIFGAATPRVQVFRASVAPTVTLGDPSDVQATQTKFNGFVNPQGGSTDWRFEYRRVGTTPWTPFPVPNGNAGSGSGDVAVQTTATGLEPNTDYEVRLVAIKGDLVVISPDPTKTFHTASVPAVIDTAPASFLGDTTATLTGGVNPRNAQTDYWFEYGTDTSYGQVAPAVPVNAGSGAIRVAVTQPIAGLEPDTTYHFRIVAENEFGQESFGDPVTFTTFATARGGVGPKRAYELATKLPVRGLPIATVGVEAAENGDDVMYRTSDTNPLHPGYDISHKAFHSRRGDAGWTVRPIDLPNVATLSFSDPVVMSVDFSHGVATSTASHHPDDQNGVIDLYLRKPDDSLTWISRAEDAVLADPDQPQTDAALVEPPASGSITRDGTTVVFRSQRRLLEADTNASGLTAGTPYRIYKWSQGELSLVSVRPDGSVPNATLGNEFYSLGAMSSDGSRVFWRDSTTIYANVDGVSKTVGVGAYAGASTDGKRVIYTAGGRLYSFDVDAEVVHDLTGAAQVQGVTAISEDGLRIYFVANAQLGAEASPLGRMPSSAGRNLYMVDVDEGGIPQRTRFIAALDAADTGTWEIFSSGSRTVDMKVDGSVLAFASVASLVGKPTGGNRQLYVYDADARSLNCASCPAAGSSPGPGNVNSALSSSADDVTASVGTWSKRQVSTDGTVFFSTRTALTSEDQNTARDVYEYRNGEVRLITRGAWDDNPSAFATASVDGRTVFFYANDALVQSDYEPGVTKLYAARVGGGFADQAPEPGCVGNACQGSGTPAPELDVPGSERFTGSGDASDPRRPAAQLRLAAIGRGQARGLASGRRIAVGAVVPGPGRVTVAVRARLRRGGPMVQVGAVTVRAPRAGRVKIGGLRLQPRALSVLRRQGSLRARVVVRQGARTSSRALRLSRPVGRNASR